MRIVALCTVEYGIDSLQYVVDSGHSIEYLIGIDPTKYSKEKVSGLIDVKDYGTKLNCKTAYIDDYGLKSKSSEAFLKSLEMDLIWVIGWQRLIPEWLISHSKFGAMGGHGSPDGINLGRGRSPQNWALMLGSNSFNIALFRITAGVDDGEVIEEVEFSYQPTDTISTSYKKVALCLGEMMVNLLDDPTKLERGIAQEESAYYYPKRTPQDGFVDWERSNEEIWNFCKALTKPYPGMRTLFYGEELVIWNLYPFDDKLGHAGVVDFVFNDNSFLVFSNDGRLMVTDYEFHNSKAKIKPGDSFESKNFIKNLRTVVDRHNSSYIDQPVTNRILRYLEE